MIVESDQCYQLDVLGPVRPDNHRQAREDRDFAARDFVIDWEIQQATCPAGCTSISWSPAIDKQKNAVVSGYMKRCGQKRVAPPSNVYIVCNLILGLPLSLPAVSKLTKNH